MDDILVKHVWIKEIPALIILKEENKNKIEIHKAVIIYHSFAHSKENTIYIGYELAKLNFICVCIDMDRHGERTNVLKRFPYQFFYNCMFCTALEISRVIQYLIDDYKIQDHEVTVMGISLGGMTALAASVIDRRVKNIITIASSANFTELAKYKNNSALARVFSDNRYDINELIEQTLEMSKKYDPYYNIDKIQDKNILMINGSLDTEIPFKIVKKFQDKVNNNGAIDEKKRDFIIINGLGHQIQNIMIEKACVWLQEIYNIK